MTQMHIYATAIRVLAKGYLHISLITPLKLKEILSEVQLAIRKTNPDYDLVIDKLLLFYDMKLVTFGIDKERNLTIQCPVCIQLHITTSNIISNMNCASSNHISEQTGTLSYTHLQIDKQYRALNSETYITIRHQQLRTCKRIGYEFYCEELCGKTEVQIQLQKHNIFQPKFRNHCYVRQCKLAFTFSARSNLTKLCRGHLLHFIYIALGLQNPAHIQGSPFFTSLRWNN